MAETEMRPRRYNFCQEEAEHLEIETTILPTALACTKLFAVYLPPVRYSVQMSTN